MKIIFLDVDGVLNNDYTTASLSSGYTFVDDYLVANLSTIVTATGAKIVLSSDWRLEYYNGIAGDDYIALENKLKEFKMEIYDRTPNINRYRRDIEISHWLSRHYSVETYIALDDTKTIFHGNTNHLILTDKRYGLTSDIVELAIKELNNK